jgi:hypothetical protein
MPMSFKVSCCVSELHRTFHRRKQSIMATQTNEDEFLSVSCYLGKSPIAELELLADYNLML